MDCSGSLTAEILFFEFIMDIIRTNKYCKRFCELQETQKTPKNTQKYS